MIVSWKEPLLRHLLLSLPEKVHCPEIPAVQPSWVCSQMDNACIKSWLLLDWATGHSSPYLFLDMCSGTYLNSPCLQVNHINTGLSWRLPEHSWTGDTQRESLQRLASAMFEKQSSPEKPFYFTTEERWKTCIYSGTPASRSEMDNLERSHQPLALTRWLVASVVVCHPLPCARGAFGFVCGLLLRREFLSAISVWRQGITFFANNIPPFNNVFLPLPVPGISLSFLSSPSLGKSPGNAIRKWCFAFDFLFPDSFRELNRPPLQCIVS